MNIGEMLSALKGMDGGKKVQFTFGEPCMPSSIHSWRGSYDEAAIGFERSHIMEDDITVKGFIDMIEDAMSRTHYGYKGGEYEFGPNTPVWVAEPSWPGNCAVCGVTDRGWMVTIDTEYREF